MARVSKKSGKKSKAKAREASPAKSHKAAKTNHPIAPSAMLRKRRSTSRRHVQPDSYFNELTEAREQQAASAEILRVINSSKGDLAPVFDIILEKAHSLCDVTSGSLQLIDGDRIRAVAVRGMTAGFEQFLRLGYRITEEMRANIDSMVPQNIDMAKRLEHNPDLPAVRETVELGGIRTLVFIPLRKDGVTLGRITAARLELRPFTDKQIAQLQQFADQAVIAIENARLFNETQEALARQTATADILRVISQSPTDVQPVFDAIVLSAVRLLGCDSSFIQLCDSATFWPVAEAGPEGLRQPAIGRAPIDPEANFPSRAIITQNNLHVPDWSVIDLPEHNRYIREQRGFNSAFYLPLLRDGKCVGLLSFASTRANAFGESEIALAESFRDQALIAIENTRMFNETKEALERQTATADILKVIASSPSDVQPVFEAIAASAKS